MRVLGFHMLIMSSSRPVAKLYLLGALYTVSKQFSEKDKKYYDLIQK